MGKGITFTSGDYVLAKNWSGHKFIGLYEYTYTDGEHCIIDAKTNKRFCAHKHDVWHADEEQVKEIKKLVKENKISLKKEETSGQEEQSELEDALAATE